ncbi:EAL domain-containing protein [Pseudoalteromonas sp. G4]|uniref:EAL domain-containing protein n=1 Tax=Pseudoalteromonas sp. G4 TaxID=2992761 RepID=UPI00237E6B88|nr:EAL domain-containing protein [Pseudoalteromonas sp. G4]MDE3270467.1 EAL domain-containing protein [Pseudoalteromonas sp. G4]
MVVEQITDSTKLSHFQQLIHRSSTPMIIMERSAFIDVNIAAKTLFQLSPEVEVTALAPHQLSPKTQSCGKSSLHKSQYFITKALHKGECKFSWRMLDAKGVQKDISVQLICLSHAKQSLFLAVISEHISIAHNYTNQFIDKALDLISDAIMLTDENNRIYYVNHAFEKITGYSFDEAYQKPAGFMKSGIHDHGFYQRLWQSLEQTGTWQGEIWDKHKEGHIYPKHVRITSLEQQDTKSPHFLAVFADCDEKVKYQQQLTKLAYYDDLTNLPNRKLLMDTLEKHIHEVNTADCQYGFWLGYFDIDDFKVINDSKGHGFGDKVIKEVLSLLSNLSCDSDMVGRMGGDEFLIIFSRRKDITQIRQVLETIYQRLAQPVYIDDMQYQVRLSGGLCQYPFHGKNAEELLSKADIAMYQAKKSEGNRYTLFETEIGDAFARSNNIELSLQNAIRNKAITPYFQPKISMQKGQLIGFESLARWQQNGQFISPAEFIPIAEKSGQISQLSLCLANQSLSMLKWFRASGDYTLAINISAKELADYDFPKALFALTETHQIPASKIEIEITESCLIDNFTNVRRQLEVLKSMQFKIALDDFGTGYSSLNYLKELSFDTIKIDRSFIHKLEHNRKNDFILLNTIIELAHNLGATVVAEGVENVEQIDFLKRFKCDFAQGFFYAKAMSFSETQKYIKHHNEFFKIAKNEH